jgi:hypothetical protein
MKRQSKAEEALHAQVKIIQNAIDECDYQAKEIQTRRSTLFELRNQFERDIIHRREAREKASIKNKL